jgi:hypothetical protein
MSIVFGVAMCVAIFLAYFLPYIIAAKRYSEAAFGVFLLNLFCGWTVFGWFAALIWAYSSRSVPPKRDALFGMSSTRAPEPAIDAAYGDEPRERKQSEGGIIVVVAGLLVVAACFAVWIHQTPRLAVRTIDDVSSSAPSLVSGGTDAVVRLWQDRPNPGLEFEPPATPHIVVPEPSPTAQGELLFQWAGSRAPLVPLGR